MKHLSIAFLAISMLGTSALAQTLQEDRQNVRTDERNLGGAEQELRHDERTGNTGAIAGDRAAVRADKQNLRGADHTLHQQRREDGNNREYRHHRHRHHEEEGNK